MSDPEVVRMQRALEDVEAGLGVPWARAVEVVAGALSGHRPALEALGIDVAADEVATLAAIEAKFAGARRAVAVSQGAAFAAAFGEVGP